MTRDMGIWGIMEILIFKLPALTDWHQKVSGLRIFMFVLFVLPHAQQFLRGGTIPAPGYMILIMGEQLWLQNNNQLLKFLRRMVMPPVFLGNGTLETIIHSDLKIKGLPHP